MAKRDASQRPGWLSSLNALRAGGVLLAVVLLLANTFAGYQRSEIAEQERRRTELLARLLERETARTLDAVSITLTSVTQRLRTLPPGRDPALAERLAEAIRGLPYLRSLSVLDADGRILVSSSDGTAGRRIDLKTLGQPVSVHDTWLGPWLPGRDLVEAAAPIGDTPRRQLPGVGIITLVHRSEATDGTALHVVAALNPDYLANHYQQILEERQLAAALLDYQGNLLTCTENITRHPGASVLGHRVLQDYLPDQEHGSYQGAGIDGTPVVTAFRASRSHPLVLVVEEPVAELDALWHRKLQWTLAGTALAVLAVLLATFAGWRSLRSHELLSDALERTRARLEDSERHLRAVIEAAPAPMFVLDPLGRYALVNQAFEDFLGVRRDDLIGHRAEDDPTLRQLAYHPAHDVGLWADGSASHYMDEITARDGSRRQALVAKVALQRPDGRSGGVIGSITDVTTFREAERRAADAQAATEAAYRAESEFIGNLSHALRTPLQSIIGFSELGLLRTRQDASLQELFDHVQRGGQRMLMLVNDLLDLSRIKNAAGTLHRTEVDTIELVDEVIRHAATDARRRSVEIVRVTADAPIGDGRALVDPLRFQQAVRTLIERAVQVSPQGSRIEVRVGRDPAGQLHWWIHDAGPGLPDNEQDAVFSAFFQSRRPGALPSDGSGLALTICRLVLRGLGGDVHYASHPDGGSVCHLRLPAMPP